MPQVPSELRTNSVYYISQTAAAAALDVGEAVLDWQWLGSGLGGELRAILNFVDEPGTGNPLPVQFTERIYRTRLWAFQDIYDAFFPEIPAGRFENVTITTGEIDATPVLIFDLHREE